jgi:hypothetical protein
LVRYLVSDPACPTAYVSISQHTSAYVGQHTSLYVSI